MAFVLNPDRVVAWPVTVTAPRDGGGEEKHRLIARYKLLPDSDLQALLSGTAPERGDRALLEAVLVGVDGITDPSGAPIPLGPDLLDALCDDGRLRTPLVHGYFECRHGAKLKN